MYAQNLHELKIYIWGACESVDMQLLSSVWNEIDDNFDVCSITKVAYIEIG
jgi:hypothetical protein